MKYERRHFFVSILLILFLLSPMSLSSSTKQPPLTVAEASNFTATSKFADVIKFIRDLQSQSSHIRVETLCVSPEGRAVPLIVIGHPVPSSPLDLHHDGKAIIYIQANIHAGEV